MPPQPTTTAELGRLFDIDLTAYSPSTTGGAQFGNTTAVGGTIYNGSGVPGAGLGVNGDFYFRTDTPGTLAQRIYVKSGGSWTNALA